MMPNDNRERRASYGNEKTWNASKLASTASSEGMSIRLFLLGDSAASAKTGQKTPEGHYVMETMNREYEILPVLAPGDGERLLGVVSDADVLKAIQLGKKKMRIFE